MICYTFAAVFFCIELPSGLQGTIIKVFKLSAKEYNLLFSAFTWPDIALSIVGGILIDRVVGLRAGFLIVTVIAILGQGLMTVGAFMNSFYLIVAGRFVLGCGIGTLKSVGNVLLALWFKNKEVIFAMSLANGSTRLGASLGLLVPHMIYELDFTQRVLHKGYYQVGFTFLVSFVFLFTSLFACIFVVYLDTRGAAKSGREPLKKRKFHWKDFTDFSLKFWVTIIGLASFYTGIYSFVANSQLYFISKFGLSIRQANTAGFLVFAAPILLTPIVGFLCQSLGYNVFWGIGSAVAGIIAHVVFNVASSDSSIVLPYVIACLVSVSYTLFATSIYVLPSFIVRDHQLTTAYNTYNIVYSVLLTGSCVISGIIIDRVGFMWLEIYYTSFFSVILSLMVAVVVLDKFSQKTKQINKPGSWLKEQLWKCKVENKHSDNNVIEDDFCFVYRDSINNQKF